MVTSNFVAYIVIEKYNISSTDTKLNGFWIKVRRNLKFCSVLKREEPTMRRADTLQT